jgi:hypothetical protein
VRDVTEFTVEDIHHYKRRKVGVENFKNNFLKDFNEIQKNEPL